MTLPTIRRRRNKTAREAAQKFGVSVRTIKRVISEPRNWYESRAAERRAQAYRLRHLGHSWAEVGAAMDGISADAARRLAARFRRAASQPAADTHQQALPLG